MSNPFTISNTPEHHEIETDEGTLSVFRTMPTRPKTQKGIKSHNTKLEKWAMKQYPNWIEINVIPTFEVSK